MKTPTRQSAAMRARILNEGKQGTGPVIYWMSRDQRAFDNWGLIFAAEEAKKLNRKFVVVFCLVDEFLGAQKRCFEFMKSGLDRTAEVLNENKIDFTILKGDPKIKISQFVSKKKAALLVTDFDPTHLKLEWKNAIAKKISVPFFEVDSRNIVPCWVASNKREFGAYTLRPKISRLVDIYLTDFPQILKGRDSSRRFIADFVKNKLASYDEERNDPSIDGQSGLSRLLHFGQIAAQRVALEVRKSKAPDKAKAAFLEELIVRRELSDNYCFYTKNYDSFDALPDWAKKTLTEHKRDRREYLYSLGELENAKTHDELWNAAQLEMIKSGRMHGYLRMYWAKKILEWSKSPEIAIKHAIYLNDKYELDGRDTNGYAGIMWAIGGLHDRAWGERKVFGKIRFMSYAGCKSKFDIKAYIEKVKKL